MPREATAPASSEAVATLYDWLSRYVRLRNFLEHGDPAGALTMHKSLRVPDAQRPDYSESETSLYLVDRALAAADLVPRPRVLDAGCGFGGTVFRWHQRVGGTYEGLTLSAVQARIARREAARRHLDGVCQFLVRSYDDPPPGPYDAVVAIEALVHSPGVARTVEGLVSRLAPGGRLVLVEDMAIDVTAMKGDEDFARLISCWRLFEVPTVDTYRGLVARLGLTIVHDEDYSASFAARACETLDRRARLYRILAKGMPGAGPRAVASALLGGVALERLYRRKLMQYRLMVACRGT